MSERYIKTVNMTYFRSTKGTHRYMEDDEGNLLAIGSLYLRKYEVVGRDAPRKLRITIEEVNE